MTQNLLGQCLAVAQDLARLYQRTNAPFALPELLEKFDIYEVRERLLDRDARLILQDDRVIIEVNSLFPTERRRFSIAHEIGHIILNECAGRDPFSVSRGDPIEETYCDRIAQVLLAHDEPTR